MALSYDKLFKTIVVLAEYGEVGALRVASALGVSVGTARKLLAFLVKTGFAERRRNGKYYVYRLTRDGMLQAVLLKKLGLYDKLKKGFGLKCRAY